MRYSVTLQDGGSKMRKATQKKGPEKGPVSLGNKRTCSRCGTKFYDFNKEDIFCPKCETRYEAGHFFSSRNAENKKPAKGVEKKADTEESSADEAHESFENVDELEDDEDDVAEDIDVDEEQEEDY